MNTITNTDLEMLRNPERWPSLIAGGRAVYVKRTVDGLPETGPCVLVDIGHYAINRHRWGKSSIEVDVLHYATAEEIYNDDWRVD